MKTPMLIVLMILFYPLFSKAQRLDSARHPINRKVWLTKRYQDSIKISRELADSIVSIEISTTGKYYQLLSEYNRKQAQGKASSVSPDYLSVFRQGAARIETLLTPDQMIIWRRLQLNKYRHYKTGAFNVDFLHADPGILRNRFISKLHFPPAIADSLVILAKSYNNRMAMLDAHSHSIRSLVDSLMANVTQLNNQAREILDTTQYKTWINWQNSLSH